MVYGGAWGGGGAGFRFQVSSFGFQVSGFGMCAVELQPMGLQAEKSILFLTPRTFPSAPRGRA